MKLYPSISVCLLSLFSSLGQAGPPPQNAVVPSYQNPGGPDGRVLAFDERTGDFVRYIAGPLLNAVLGGATIGPDGRIYLSSRPASGNELDGRIVAIEFESGVVTEFVAPNTSPLDAPNGILFGPEGHLYATSNAPGLDEIYRFDGGSGAYIDTVATGLITPVDLAFGEDGLLYVTNGNALASSVYRFEPTTGQFVDIFIPTGAGGLSGPSGLAFGKNGNLFIASAFSNQVIEFDGETGLPIAPFAELDGLGLDTPTDLVFGPDGNLYVVANSTALGGRAVVEFDGNTGEYLGRFVSETTGLLGAVVTGLNFLDPACNRYRDGGLSNRCFFVRPKNRP